MANPSLIPVVATTTVLAALGASSSQYKTVFVSGTNVSYTWNPSSTDTADGVYIIAATGVSTGRWWMDQPTTLVTKSWRNIFELIIQSSNGPAIIDAIQANTSIGTLDTFFAEAIAIGGSWYFPPGSYFLADTIHMAAGVEFHGAGMGNTLIYTTPGADPWGFQMLNPNGTENIEGFKLYDMTIFVTGNSNGIRWNSATGGFDNGAGTQQFMMRATMERVFLAYDSAFPNTTIGVQMNKCFDSVVEDCYLGSWGTGIHFKGTDLSRIENNRIILSPYNAIIIESSGTFGSTNRIVHNDILSPGTSGNSSSTALTTSDRDGYFCENYIEGFASVNHAIVVNGGFNHKINDNRIEWDAATSVLFVDSGAISANIQYGLQFKNNHTTDQMGSIVWNGNLGYYFNNSAKRNYIQVSGNTAIASRVPFNSDQDNSLPPPSILAYFTAGRSGVAVTGLSLDVQCDSGYFKIAPNSDVSKYIQFSDYTQYSFPANKLAGTYSVNMLWYSDTAGQTLSYQVLDNTSSVTTGTLTATNANQFYGANLLASHTFTDFPVIRFWNADTGTGGSCFIDNVSVPFG